RELCQTSGCGSQSPAARGAALCPGRYRTTAGRQDNARSAGDRDRTFSGPFCERGQAFPDTLRRPLMGYRPCGQTVISENAQILHQDVSLRAVRLLAVPCLALKKAVQIFLAAIEAVGQVLAAQLLDRAVVHSRTLGV